MAAMAGPLPDARQARLRPLRDQAGRLLDRGLVLWFPAPESFTGEDVAEFHVHGGRAVVRAVLDALTSATGLRLAEPGEFTRRAFDHGKLDLTEAEGLADLIEADTEQQRRQALALAGGALRGRGEAIRAALLRASALVEAALDFSDEGDVAADAVEQAEAVVGGLRAEIAQLLEGGRRGELVRDGFRVVLAGAPNAGKSSLINMMARREVAIVSPTPGTTRDAIEVALDLGGHFVLLTDTAGVRATDDAVEFEGVRRTRERMREADLVIWVVDVTQPISPSKTEPGCRDSSCTDSPLILLRNKIDLIGETVPANSAGEGVLSVSARTGEGVDALLRCIQRYAESAAGSGESVLVTHHRQRRCLEDAAAEMELFGHRDLAIELRAEHLRRASFALGRLVGVFDAEDVLGEIFGRFCIGK